MSVKSFNKFLKDFKILSQSTIVECSRSHPQNNALVFKFQTSSFSGKEVGALKCYFYNKIDFNILTCILN